MTPSAEEVRLRCIEAAAKAPMTHEKGYAAAVLETAAAWEEYVREGRKLSDVTSLM